MTESLPSSEPTRRSAFVGGLRARRARPSGEPAAATCTVRAEPRPRRAQPSEAGQDAGSVKPPPRRQPHRILVGLDLRSPPACWRSAALAGGLAFRDSSSAHADAEQARDQRFVDTATQTVVNMFSYKQDNIDESVNRFVNGTSGPLRGMLSANNNVENLKALFRSTNATSEAVINGAALEGIDASPTTRRCWYRCASRSPTSTGSTSRPCPIGCGSSCTRTRTGG